MTALLPTRWISSLSTNLIHLQVDTEINQARESEKNQDSKEDETEVVKCPHAENPTKNFYRQLGPLLGAPCPCIKNPFFRSDASRGRQNAKT